MPIIDDLELPIKPLKIRGKGVIEIESRKEDNHRGVLQVSELQANLKKVAAFSELKAILGT